MNNIILGALLFFICSTGIFAYVSYSLSEEKGMAVQALQEAHSRLADSEKSIETSIFSCQITDGILTEWQTELAVQQDKTQTVISKIDTLPKKTISQVNQDAEIDIDSPLPDSIVELLNESCLPDEGEVCTNAK